MNKQVLKELNQKLDKLHKDYIRDSNKITNESRARELKAQQEYYNKIYEVETRGLEQKPSKTTQNETIEEVKEELTPRQKEIRDLYRQWKIYQTSFPQYKNIWVLNFPQWFVEMMENR